jgi:hypothetical protein
LGIEHDVVAMGRSPWNAWLGGLAIIGGRWWRLHGGRGGRDHFSIIAWLLY